MALPLPKNPVETKENSLASTKRSKFRAAENSQSPKPIVNLRISHQQKQSYRDFKNIVKPWGELHSENSTDKNDNQNHYLSTQYGYHSLLSGDDSLISPDTDGQGNIQGIQAGQ